MSIAYIRNSNRSHPEHSKWIKNKWRRCVLHRNWYERISNGVRRCDHEMHTPSLSSYHFRMQQTWYWSFVCPFSMRNAIICWGRIKWKPIPDSPRIFISLSSQPKFHCVLYVLNEWENLIWKVVKLFLLFSMRFTLARLFPLLLLLLWHWGPWLSVRSTRKQQRQNHWQNCNHLNFIIRNYYGIGPIPFRLNAYGRHGKGPTHTFRWMCAQNLWPRIFSRRHELQVRVVE